MCCAVLTALQGWPGTKIWCDKRKGKSKKKRALPDRDFKALNRGAIDLGVVTVPEVRSYRSVYDARMKAAEDDSLRRAPLVFPPGMTFGHPPRYAYPIVLHVTGLIAGLQGRINHSGSADPIPT